MRRKGIEPIIIETSLSLPSAGGSTRKGNSVAVERDDGGRTLEIVLASDVPGYVITVIMRESGDES
jgi:hypothetical protein